jgi:EAL domain-containing protein (putative c-di-GMP-specific phosphodiesterase class I)
MALPLPARSGDLFLTRKGKLSRVRGRAQGPPDRWTPPSVTEREGAESAQRLDDRQGVIRATLANQDFEIVFQPIVDLRTGGVAGAEALTRFEMLPDRSPDVWFAEAREIGLGVELEMAALRLALGQLRQLPSGLYLSLNASPDTMMSAEFRALVAEAPAERVVLELTEHDRIDDYELFGQAASELRSHGVRLAVDDAGAGFSSFRHILNLRPDIIKLDIGLTRGIDGDPARRALGSAMLAFGLDAFGAAIVAEGIETEGEFKTLRGLGCRFGQGYYLGRPGKLKLPRPQFDSAQPPRPAGDGETQPTLVTKATGADSDSGSRHLSGMQPRHGRLLAPDGRPLQSDSRTEGVSEPDERPRDAQDELLALVAELEVRPRDANERWTGDRSRVRLFR